MPELDLTQAIRDGPSGARLRGLLEDVVESAVAGFAREIAEMQTGTGGRCVCGEQSPERKALDERFWVRIEGVRADDLTRVLDAGLADGADAKELADAVLRAFGGRRLVAKPSRAALS